MNSDMAHGAWVELKGKIKTQWSKFTDDDLEAVKGNLEELTGKLQKVYGYAKEKAAEEFDHFKQMLEGTAEKMDDQPLKKANETLEKVNEQIDRKIDPKHSF